jgi:nucleoside-diphosphate-sugar epimerase
MYNGACQGDVAQSKLLDRSSANSVNSPTAHTIARVARALVTGGTGFLGLHLARALGQSGYEVRTLDIHPPGPRADPDWEFVNADVRDPDAMAKAVRGVDVVLDNAALVPVTRSDAATYRSVNVDGCRTTLEAARNADVYVLHISSSAIYGIPNELPIMPTTPLAPFEPYGESKAAAEAVVVEARRNGQPVASLRPRTLLGEGRLGIFDVIFARIRAGKRVPMFGAGRNKVQMSDSEDFCSAALKAIEKQANDDYNVGAAVYGSVREDLQALIDHARTTATPTPVPTAAIRVVLEPLDAIGRSPFKVWHWKSAPKPFYFDLTKTKRELDWEPRYSNAEALIRAYDRYLERPQATSASAHRRPLEGGLARVLRG